MRELPKEKKKKNRERGEWEQEKGILHSLTLQSKPKDQSKDTLVKRGLI